MLLSPAHHRWIYLGALALVAVGLPLSKAFMSIGGITLAVNFLLEGQFKQRLKTISTSPIILLLIGVFFLHVIGMAWSTDFEHGLKDLRVKLPLLLFPIVIPLSAPLSRKEFLLITGLFTATVILTSFLSTFEYLQIKDVPSADFRSISLFTSHIRYALMVCVAYLFLLNLAWTEEENIGARLSYILLATWLSIFIFILQSMTGIIIWLLCSYLLLLYTVGFVRSARLKTIGYTVLTVTPILVSVYLFLQVDAFYPDRLPDFKQLEQTTAGGEPYIHDTTSLNLENGNYINLYIAYHELEVEWNQRSEIPFWGGKDNKNQPINATLMRYLTSKGLHKDSVGINALTETDIEAIENGIANVRFTYGNALDNRVYTVIWEFDRMLKEKRVQGHSVTQRIVFWKTGWEIFKDNWVTGVGTGDINHAFNKMYDKMGVSLKKKFRLRTHNQYLAFGITFGFFGFLIFLASAIWPFFTLRNANTFLYIGFAIVVYASMLNEDTLETQSGVTLYAFFNALFLFGVQSLPRSDDRISS